MQRHLYEHFNVPGHSGFLNDVSVTLIDWQTLKILLNEKITGFTPLKPKHHWDLMFKIVFRRNSLNFASRITFMDGLFFNNDFRAQFLSFYYFYCYWCCLLVFLLQFLVFLFCWCFYYYRCYCYYIFIKFSSHSSWLC